MWNSAHWSGSFSFWSLCHVTRYLFQHPSKKSPCLTGMAKCTDENGCCSFSYTVSRHQPVLWKQANKCLELQGREKDVIVTEQYLHIISVKIIIIWAILKLPVRLVVYFVKIHYENVWGDSKFDQKLGQSSNLKTDV